MWGVSLSLVSCVCYIVTPPALHSPCWNPFPHLLLLSQRPSIQATSLSPFPAFPIGFGPLSIMPRGGHRQRGKSRRGGVVDRHTQSVVAPATEAYEAHTPPHIHVELDLAEADARVLHRFFDHDVVDAEIGQWIPDPGSYRERATLYTKTIDLYWLLKTMMGKVLVERNEAHEEIFLQLDEMQMEILGLGRKMDRLLNSNVDAAGLSHVYVGADEPPPGAPPGPSS
jgi:hypothetical protein